MSEKDPYAQKRKDSNDESRMADEMPNDADPDVSGGSTGDPQDDINPARPKTNMPNNKQMSDEDDDNTM